MTSSLKLPMLSSDSRSASTPTRTSAAHPKYLRGLSHSFLLTCSGANKAVLAYGECSGDQLKYKAIGILILCTSLMAMMSSAFALFMVFGNLLVALSLSCLWAFVIASIDRFFIITLRKSARRRLWIVAVVAPRLLIAICAGVVVSTPLELRIFDPEINEQLTVDEVRARAVYARELHGAFPERDRLEKEKNQLQNEIIQSEQRRDSSYADAVNEAEGLEGTHLRGFGRVYAEKQAFLNTRSEELKAVRDRNESRIQELDNKLAEVNAERDATLASAVAAQHRGRGLLARIAALHEIAFEGKHAAILSTAIVLLFFIFVAIDAAPILGKLMAPIGPYELIVANEERACAQFEQRYVEHFSTLLNLQLNHREHFRRAELDSVQTMMSETLAELRHNSGFAELSHRALGELMSKIEDDLYRAVNLR